MIRIYTELSRSDAWFQAVKGACPLFICVLGFTETGLIPGISAAGATPYDRQFTAIADAEFLYTGPSSHPRHPLPPLRAGASPVLISRAITRGQSIPVWLMNAGLREAPTVPCINLGGQPAQCLTTGQALDKDVVHHLLQTGMEWGNRLGQELQDRYLILGECVVGGTTTALALLTGLGFQVDGMVNSSLPDCNHDQKRLIVEQGIAHLGRYYRNTQFSDKYRSFPTQRNVSAIPPEAILATLGDPVQAAIAGIVLTASQKCKVMLAGGTQMLAIYAIAKAISATHTIAWNPDNVLVGTTRWVAEDPTGNTIGLAQLLRCPLAATRLSFAGSRYKSLRAYEQGFVKEGVGAGGCAIASHLYQYWGQEDLLRAIETVAASHEATHKISSNP